MKRTRRKEAKFFCESCGSEVPANAKICPFCGKFFASVRCPKCGRTGTSDEFKNGCPTCGYAVDLSNLNNNLSDNKRRIKQKRQKKNNFTGLFNDQKKNNNLSDSKGVESGLPIWIYIFTIAIFLILVICLYSCL